MDDQEWEELYLYNLLSGAGEAIDMIGLDNFLETVLLYIESEEDTMKIDKALRSLRE